MDICEEILHDHNKQRRLFGMIEQLGTNDPETAQAVWQRLANLLEVHAEAEEEHFYPRLLDIGEGAGDADDAAEETRDAIGDHNGIRSAISRVDKYEAGSAPWLQAVAQVNLANSEHMAEEERQGMADFRAHTSLEERYNLARKFVTCKFRHLDGIEATDKDPANYVARHRERVHEKT